MANSGKRQKPLTVIDITDDNSSSNQTKGSKKSTHARQSLSRIAKNKTTPAAEMSSSLATTITVSNDDSSFIEKRCENPDCAAPTLISLVPTRPIPQFIHNPTVVSEPILVNGYTTVFEIGGITAKVSELNTLKCPDGKIRYKSRKPIFRIVPNTHAHIVNYVIIDAEGETLEKIKQNDPPTIKKLLESQKNSAEQLLEKLICFKKPPPAPEPPVRITKIVPAPPPLLQKPVAKVSASNTIITGISAVPAASLPTLTTPVIASISSGVSEVIAVGGASPSSAPSPPQAQPQLLPESPMIIPAQQVISTTTALEKMQSELRELRETVKLLSEQKRASSGPEQKDSKKQKTS